MNSSTTPDFWESYARLPPETKERARRVYRLWRANPYHPSLRFKKVSNVWSVEPDGGGGVFIATRTGVWHWPDGGSIEPLHAVLCIQRGIYF